MNFFENNIFVQIFNINLNLKNSIRKIKNFKDSFKDFFKEYFKKISNKAIIKIVKNQAGLAHVISFALD
jgi:hypothetical protein